MGTIGFIARTRVIDADASLVTILRQAGAGLWTNSGFFSLTDGYDHSSIHGEDLPSTSDHASRDRQLSRTHSQPFQPKSHCRRK